MPTVLSNVRFQARPCENVHEPRMPRIVFSIAFFQDKLPVQLVSASMKSRWKFYTQVRRRSFRTAWKKRAPMTTDVCCYAGLWPQLSQDGKRWFGSRLKAGTTDDRPSAPRTPSR